MNTEMLQMIKIANIICKTYSKNEEQKQSKEFFDELICYAKANIFIHLISKL